MEPCTDEFRDGALEAIRDSLGLGVCHVQSMSPKSKEDPSRVFSRLRTSSACWARACIEPYDVSTHTSADQALLCRPYGSGPPARRSGGPGIAALFSVHKLVGARQVRPAPLYWGPHLERVALAGPIPEPHAP